MNLQQSYETIKCIDEFLNLINNTITGLYAEKTIGEDEVYVKVRLNDVKDNVATFIYDKMSRFLQKKSTKTNVFYLGFYKESYCNISQTEGFTVTFVAKNTKIAMKDLITALYLAVDEAKIEFCFHIVEQKHHEIPNEIYWELDSWNDDWIEDGEEQNCVPPENLRVYGFKKEWLASIHLGYYTVDLSLFESDIVPELIGVLFGTTEDFCYVTSYEDESWVYLYTVVELNEDHIFDIEENLFNTLGLISATIEQCDLTLEDYFSIVSENNDN